MTMLSNGAAWLAGQMQTHAAESVTYHRGTSMVTLKAVPGSTSAEQTDAAGMTVGIELRDWIIQAADLVLDGVLTTPQRGDIIKVRRAFATEVFEVLDLGSGPCYRPSDQHGCVLRVHTKPLTPES